MAKLSDLIIKIGADTKELNKSLGDAQRRIQATTGNIQNLGKQMSMAFTLPAALIGGSSLMVFKDFELQMAKVGAVSGATGAEFAALEENAKKLGRETKFTATEVAMLQTEYAKLGFSATEIVAVTDATLALAQATDSELGRAAEVTGNTLRGFQLPVSDTGRVADVMAASFSKSALDMEVFAESMKFVAPVAQNAGLSLEQTTAMLGQLANSGVKGSQAGTALRAIISQLAGNGEDLTKVLGDLSKQNLSLADAEELVGREAQTALLVLANGAAGVDTLTTSLENSRGAAEAMRAKMDETAAGAMARMQSAIEGAQIEIGSALAPTMISLSETIATVAGAFTGLDDGTQKFIIAIVAGVAAVGPMLVVLPKLVAGFGMVKVAIMQGIIPALQRMMTFMVANPYLLVATAVVALGVAMSDYVSFADAGAKAQQTYSNAMTQAGVEAAKNGAEVTKLAKIVGDETVEEEKRIAALQRLQQISPEHFGNLTKESALTASLTESVKAYRMELMRAAQVKVLNQQLEEATARMIELEAEMAKGPSMGDKLLGAFAGPAGSIGLMSKRLGDDLGETAATIDLLTAKLSELETPADIVAQTVAGTTTQVKALGTEVKKAATEVEDFAETFRREMLEDLKNMPLELPVKPKMKLHTIDPIEEDTSEFDMDFEKDYEAFKAGQEMMRAEWEQTAARTQQFGEMFGQTIGSVVSGGETAGEAMKKLAVNVVQTLIGIAQAAVIANATQTATATGAAALPMTPILIAAGLGLVSAAIGAIAFADGGIVSGPTLGLVGEYAGAKNNPEVIAPLDKLKSMIGDSGGGNIAVHGKLQGNDINISGERGKLNQSRTR
jgi:hypothetical protein